MFNQDEGKTECTVGNREMGFLQGKKAGNVLISFLTSGFAVFISLGTAKFKQLDHVLWDLTIKDTDLLPNEKTLGGGGILGPPFILAHSNGKRLIFSGS